MTPTPDTRGLYGKFHVRRTDGQDGPTDKHYNCEYFVLDLDHDPHAIPALKAYANSCRKDYPALSADLDKLVIVRTARFFTGFDR